MIFSYGQLLPLDSRRLRCSKESHPADTTYDEQASNEPHAPKLD